MIVRLLQRSSYAFFYAIDLAASALTLGGPGETISARLGKVQKTAPDSFFGHMATILDNIVLATFGAAHHCAGALAAYEAREAVSPFGE